MSTHQKQWIPRPLPETLPQEPSAEEVQERKLAATARPSEARVLMGGRDLGQRITELERAMAELGRLLEQLQGTSHGFAHAVGARFDALEGAVSELRSSLSAVDEAVARRFEAILQRLADLEGSAHQKGRKS